MVAGVPTESVSPLADAGNADLGTSPYSGDDYQAISYYADPTKKEGPKEYG